jgi:hypothetical protein
MDQELSNQLTEIARCHAEERGWTWRGEVKITDESFKGEAVWAVHSNAMMRGINARILIRKSDLAIVHSGYMPR